MPLVLLNTMELWPNTVVVASYNAAVQHDVDDKFVLTLDSKLAVAPGESKNRQLSIPQRNTVYYISICVFRFQNAFVSVSFFFNFFVCLFFYCTRTELINVYSFLSLNIRIAQNFNTKFWNIRHTDHSKCFAITSFNFGLWFILFAFFLNCCCYTQNWYSIYLIKMWLSSMLMMLRWCRQVHWAHHVIVDWLLIWVN